MPDDDAKAPCLIPGEHYDVFSVSGFPQLQKDDENTADMEVSDDDVAVAFVRAVEKGDPKALHMLKQFLVHDLSYGLSPRKCRLKRRLRRINYTVASIGRTLLILLLFLPALVVSAVWFLVDVLGRHDRGIGWATPLNFLHKMQWRNH